MKIKFSSALSAIKYLLFLLGSIIQGGKKF